MFRKQIFILLALCGSMQVFAQTDVSGIVSDSSSGRTLADATVSLVNAKGNSVAFTLSNTDGSFRLSRVSSGSYKLMYRTLVTKHGPGKYNCLQMASYCAYIWLRFP